MSTGAVSSTLARTSVGLKAADSGLRCRMVSGKDGNFLKVNDHSTIVGIGGTRTDIRSRVHRFLSDIFGTVGLRIAVSVGISRSGEGISIRLGNPRVNILVNGENRALSSLRCLAGLTVGGRSRGCCEMGVSARSCEGEEERALRGLTGGVSFGIGHAGEPISLRPVGPFREEIVRSTLRGSEFIRARDRNSRPCERIIIALGGW